MIEQWMVPGIACSLAYLGGYIMGRLNSRESWRADLVRRKLATWYVEPNKDGTAGRVKWGWLS